VADILKKY